MNSTRWRRTPHRMPRGERARLLLAAIERAEDERAGRLAARLEARMLEKRLRAAEDDAAAWRSRAAALARARLRRGEIGVAALAAAWGMDVAECKRVVYGRGE